jgi:hypothetical protein
VRAHELPVGFSDDRRFFVPFLVLFLVFILASVGPRGGMVLLPWKMMRLQMSSGTRLRRVGMTLPPVRASIQNNSGCACSQPAESAHVAGTFARTPYLRSGPSKANRGCQDGTAARTGQSPQRHA